MEIKKNVLTSRLRNQIYLFIGLVFVIRLLDSLYIRQHGDALNYHLYAPLNWARFDWLYVNTFQSTHYQSGWFEMLITALFEISWPKDIPTREYVLKTVQVMSCTVGYLCVPLLIVKRFSTRVSHYGLWLLLCTYYACEYMLFTAQFAKNDIWASFFFLWGVTSPVFWVQILGLSVASGIKFTYLYAAALFLLFQLRKNNFVRTSIAGFVILILPSLIWIKNYLATGYWFFPIPSERGLQTSMWLKEHFWRYSTKSNFPEVLHKISDLALRTPVLWLLVPLSLYALIKNKNSLTQSERLFLTVPIIYGFITGPYLEWRTFSGIPFYALFLLVILIDGLFKNNKLGIIVLCLFGLGSSKIDPSSASRFLSGSGKTFAELTRDGFVFERANRVLNDQDILLTLLTNEGFFLIPQIYTANEHPAREEILERFPILNGIKNFIAIKTDGKCLASGDQSQFVQKLLQKSESDLQKDEEQEGLFHLALQCAD